MDNEKKTFYDSCSECRFAEFIDYQTVKCGKSVAYDPDTECGEFEDRIQNKKKESSHLLEIANEIDEIQEREESRVIEELKKVEPTEIVPIVQGDVIEDEYEQASFCINTKKDCRVYDAPKVSPKHLLRTESKNELIPFHRMVIRNGSKFVMLKDENGKRSYILDEGNNFDECVLAEVGKEAIDILFMPHNLFDQTCNSTKLLSGLIKEAYSTHIKSSIQIKNRSTIVSIKDVFQKDGKEIAIVNNLTFNQEIPKLRIGRLSSNSYFYILGHQTDKYARKIKLTDGTEAILFSNSETYSEQKTKLESFVASASIVLVVSIIIFAIGFTLANTGYFIFIGILLIPLLFIIKMFFSVPLYIVLSQIAKRL